MWLRLHNIFSYFTDKSDTIVNSNDQADIARTKERKRERTGGFELQSGNFLNLCVLRIETQSAVQEATTNTLGGKVEAPKTDKPKNSSLQLTLRAVVSLVVGSTLFLAVMW